MRDLLFFHTVLLSHLIIFFIVISPLFTSNPAYLKFVVFVNIVIMLNWAFFGECILNIYEFSLEKKIVAETGTPPFNWGRKIYKALDPFSQKLDTLGPAISLIVSLVKIYYA